MSCLVSLIFRFIFLVYFIIENNNSTFILSWKLVAKNRFNIEFLLLFDLISILFLIAVLIITFSVILFRYSYMENEKFFNRFHWLIFLFVCSILLLICSQNFISLLFGWDGLGISSYLLVIYYNSRITYNSGIVTALSNRVGDALILILISLLFSVGSWNSVWIKFYFEIKYIRLLLIFSACTKRAQVPFRAWLPAAIAAPTPVSALVHSSTLVTAGVYLLIRHSWIIECFSCSKLLLVIGVLTIIGARVSALFEKDIKKVVALSTLRQLGVIIISLGINLPITAILHLLIHAFFKAIIFIRVGQIIHNFNNFQLLRFTGGSFIRRPFLLITFISSSVSLRGVPFAAAFFSKEPIINMLLRDNYNLAGYLFIILGALLTVLYRVRIIMLAGLFWSRRLANVMVSEEINNVIIRVLLLFIPAFIGGAIIRNRLSFFRIHPMINLEHKTIILFIISLGLISSLTYNNTMTEFFISKNISWLSTIYGIMFSSSIIYNLVSFYSSMIRKVLNNTFFLASIIFTSPRMNMVKRNYILNSNKLSKILLTVPLVLLLFLLMV